MLKKIAFTNQIPLWNKFLKNRVHNHFLYHLLQTLN